MARHENSREIAIRVRNLAGEKAKEHALSPSGKEFIKIYWDVMLWLARNKYLDAYLLYLEKNRPVEKRFYQNRRSIMKPVVNAMQDLIDDKLDELFISMPPRVGKTAFSNFLTSFIVGLEPESTNLYCSCNAGVAETFYKGVVEIINDDATYTFNEIFPDAVVAGTNAKEHTQNSRRI